jgi:hypothetical protein
MGVLFDYFLADSDEVAASVLESSAGEAGLPFMDGRGIDPVVMMGTAEALLTDRTYEEVDAARGVVPPVAMADEGTLVVLRLPDTLVAALAGATDLRLAEVAGPWSQTEEFWGEVDPDVLGGFLGELAELARQAQSGRQHMYCWVCV